MISIDLSPYKIQQTFDGSEVYEINIGSTSPLHAREHQKKLVADKRNRKIVYRPENGVPFSLLVSDREFQLLSVLRDGQWHSIETLKTTKSETRKPISDLRQLALIIGTKRKPGQYKLFGQVELYPLGLCIGINRIIDILPGIVECKTIEDARAKAGIAKRVARIKKSVDFLMQEGE